MVPRYNYRQQLQSVLTREYAHVNYVCDRVYAAEE